jgi:peptide deformylase
MSLRIVHYNETVLREKGRRVTVFDAELAALAQAMVETMREAEGIGLAAQQIGRPLQFCVVDVLPLTRSFRWALDGVAVPLELIMPLALANPAVTALPSATVFAEEGCLSFPEIRGDVPRAERISVAYQDLHGVARLLECDGMLARCIQHEVDHLNGVLFIDRMDKKVRQDLDPAVRELALRTRQSQAARPVRDRA